MQHSIFNIFLACLLISIPGAMHSQEVHIVGCPSSVEAKEMIMKVHSAISTNKKFSKLKVYCNGNLIFNQKEAVKERYQFSPIVDQLTKLCEKSNIDEQYLQTYMRRIPTKSSGKFIIYDKEGANIPPLRYNDIEEFVSTAKNVNAKKDRLILVFRKKKPVIRISNLGNSKQALSSIQGTATSEFGIKAIFVRFDNEEWILANGSSTWSIPMPQGLKKTDIEAIAIDALGDTSDVERLVGFSVPQHVIRWTSPGDSLVSAHCLDSDTQQCFFLSFSSNRHLELSDWQLELRDKFGENRWYSRLDQLGGQSFKVVPFSHEVHYCLFLMWSTPRVQSPCDFDPKELWQISLKCLEVGNSISIPPLRFCIESFPTTEEMKKDKEFCTCN